MATSNAWDDVLGSTTQDENVRALFLAEKYSGNCIDNATALTVLNTGASTVFLWSKGHHGEEPSTANWARLGAGKSVTFGVWNNEGNGIIDVRAKCGAAETTTLNWFVSERR